MSYQKLGEVTETWKIKTMQNVKAAFLFRSRKLTPATPNGTFYRND